MHRGRPKGFKLTDEHKKAMQEGRKQAKAIKAVKSTDVGSGKPKLFITGTEKDALDFFPAIRESLRPLNKNKECNMLCNEIAHMPLWQNVRIVLNRLQDIFDIVEVENKIPKKVRTRRPLTEEEKDKLRINLIAARAKKKENK
jgi:hypothetical protein